jgi:hypothetical protein
LLTGNDGKQDAEDDDEKDEIELHWSKAESPLNESASKHYAQDWILRLRHCERPVKGKGNTRRNNDVTAVADLATPLDEFIVMHNNAV